MGDIYNCPKERYGDMREVEIRKETKKKALDPKLTSLMLCHRAAAVRTG